MLATPHSQHCAQIIEAAVNALAASVALIALFAIYSTWPAATSWWSIPLVAILIAFTVGFSMFVAGLTVYLRDLRHALPQALQLGFFVTPIFWSLSGLSRTWQIIVCTINPNAAVIDGLRHAVLWGETPDLTLTGIAAVVSVAWLIGSFLLFKRLETGFADVS